VEVLRGWKCEAESSKDYATGREIDMTMTLAQPQGREYKSWRLMRYEKSKPEKREPFKPATEYLATNYKILAFKLLALKPGYVYELTWFYK
jgi:hypothetical protein